MEPAADDRDRAEALAAALEYGLATVGEAIAWADAVIEREATPPSWICALALMGDRHPLDVVPALRDAPGSPRRDAVDALVLAHLRDAFASRPERVVAALYQMSNDDRVLPHPSLKEIASWADDELALADQGISLETRAEIFAQVAVALEEAATAVARRQAR